MSNYFPYFGTRYCPECKLELQFIEETISPFSFEYGGTVARDIYRCNSTSCQAMKHKGYFTFTFVDDPSGSRHEDVSYGRY